MDTALLGTLPPERRANYLLDVTQALVQHDAQGRVVLRQQKRLSAKPLNWHYIWDADDRLLGVTTPDGAQWRYHYDPLGRRIAKHRLGADGMSVAEQVDFTWDGVVLAEQTHTTGADDHGRTTVWEWEPDSFRPLTQTERAPLRDAPQDWVNEQFYAIVTDLIGTPTEMLDTDGDLVWHPAPPCGALPQPLFRTPFPAHCASPGSTTTPKPASTTITTATTIQLTAGTKATTRWVCSLDLAFKIMSPTLLCSSTLWV